MTHIFTLGDEEEESSKLNLDDLYEKKREQDLNRLSIFNKLLGRIHNKIRISSRQNTKDQFCSFIVPEVMIGIPRYDQGECIAYLMEQLTENGFQTRYIHPNCIFISWVHWVPSYVRTEIKKKTGVAVDGYGKIIKKKTDNDNDNNNNKEIDIEIDDINALILTGGGQNNNQNKTIIKKKEYTSIGSYKPQGNFVYNEDMMKKIADKVKK